MQKAIENLSILTSVRRKKKVLRNDLLKASNYFMDVRKELDQITNFIDKIIPEKL